MLGVTPFPEPVDPGLATGSYLLAVGQLMPRKDFHTLLRAFARARVGDARLVLAGPPGIDEASLRAAAQQLGIGERVVFAGPVSDALLAGLYAGAIALCFPSIAEGFGLPLLEAMAAGLPVVASDIDVVDEVCGDAALRFPVHDQDALAAALEEIVRDEAARSSLRVAGRARAAQFTWDRTAELTVQGYERALL